MGDGRPKERGGITVDTIQRRHIRTTTQFSLQRTLKNEGPPSLSLELAGWCVTQVTWSVISCHSSELGVEAPCTPCNPSTPSHALLTGVGGVVCNARNLVRDPLPQQQRGGL